MARHIRTAAFAHDISHGSRRARRAGERCNLAVGRHTAWRDSPHHRQHTRRERAWRKPFVPIASPRRHCSEGHEQFDIMAM